MRTLASADASHEMLTSPAPSFSHFSRLLCVACTKNRQVKPTARSGKTAPLSSYAGTEMIPYATYDISMQSQSFACVSMSARTYSDNRLWKWVALQREIFEAGPTFMALPEELG